MKPFDDPEGSRPKLPADALVYVAEAEGYVSRMKADRNTAPFFLMDTASTLIAIVREQGALLETALVAADVAATALEMCAAENDSLRNSRTALEEQAWRISEERDALRDRLAKLETAAKRALVLLLESSACDEPCDCIDCQCIETLDALGLVE